MNIDNYIETQYRELLIKGINIEFLDLYNTVENTKLREVLSTLHYYFVSLFRTMNQRLPTGDNGAHFWADPSRDLISIIEITLGLYNSLKNSKFAFEIDDYYFSLIKSAETF